MESRKSHHDSPEHGGHTPHDCGHALQPVDTAEAARVTDPVCGMNVDPQRTRHRAEHAGDTHYFCSAGCRAKFVADPMRYLEPSSGPQPAAPASPGIIFTCPMHPEIRQVGPGACPICGMGLEPLVASQDFGPNSELVDMTRRFWIGLALAVPLVVLEMGGHLFNLQHSIPQYCSNWIQLAFATPVVLWAGLAILRARLAIDRHAQSQYVHADRDGDWRRLALQRDRDDHARTVSPAFRGAHGTVAVYFEAAAVITVLVLLGQVLELRARETRAARSARFST